MKAKDPKDWGKRKGGPLESTIEKKVKEYARSLGVLVRKYSSPSQRSVPDDIFFFNNGVTLLIEFKRKGKKPTPAQAQEIKKLQDRGHHVYVIDSIERGISVVNWYFDTAAAITRT